MNGVQSALAALTPAAGVWSIVGLLVLTLIKGWPKLKQIQATSDASLRHDLLEENTRLRAEAAAERVIHAAKIEAMDLKHTAFIKDLVERHDRRVHDLEETIRAMQREMAQFAESLRRDSMNAPTTIGTAIAKAYPVPCDMQDQIKKLDGEEGQ